MTSPPPDFNDDPDPDGPASDGPARVHVGRSAMPPGLYFVATPIGAADDITLRGLRILQEAELLAAEDTRRARQLLGIHGVDLAGRTLVSYHDHNAAGQRPRLLAALAQGQRVAYVSDAGTPLIADPGYRLASEAIAAGHQVFAAPGASALLAALTVAGQPTDRFFFGGFLPPKSAARRKMLTELRTLSATLVFYESARRLGPVLADMAAVLGPGRAATLCRELTKKFEETRRGTLQSLAEEIAAGPGVKGECVIVIGPRLAREVTDDDIALALPALLQDMSVKEASTMLSQDLGVARRRIYNIALGLAGPADADG